MSADEPQLPMVVDPWTGPEQKPRIDIEVRVVISGEWVSRAEVAHAARSLAVQLAGQLDAAAGDERDEVLREVAMLPPDERAELLSRYRHPSRGPEAAP